MNLSYKRQDQKQDRKSKNILKSQSKDSRSISTSAEKSSRPQKLATRKVVKKPVIDLSGVPWKKVLIILSIISVALFIFIWVKGVYKLGMDRIDSQRSINQKEIEYRVAKKIGVLSEPISISRIMDAATLKQQSDFYLAASNGDYIVRYEDRIVVYSLKEDKIVVEKAADQNISQSPLK